MASDPQVGPARLTTPYVEYGSPGSDADLTPAGDNSALSQNQWSFLYCLATLQFFVYGTNRPHHRVACHELGQTSIIGAKDACDDWDSCRNRSGGQPDHPTLSTANFEYFW